jgi:purine-binding chemotaxis protein CheW
LTAAPEPVLTFFLGKERFAAAASDIAEVLRPPRVVRVPNGPHSLLGLAGLGGAPTPVISLARLLDRPERPSASSRVLVLRGQAPIGLEVERVAGLAAVAIEAAPASDAHQGFGRLYAAEGEALRLIDLDGLLRRAFAAGLGGRSGAAPAAAAAVEDAQQAEGELALLGFELAGQLYGLPLDEVQAVLAAPSGLATLPQSDDAALGVVSTQDRLLPLVSLHRLLGLQAEPQRGGRVVVIRIGDSEVGLVVDRLQPIVRLPPGAVDPAPAVLNRTQGEAQVQSIGRPSGGPLMAILSGARLFRDEKLMQILDDGRDVHSADTAASAAEPQERFLIFRLGAEEYGLPLSAVDEVVRLPEHLTRVPKAPAFIEGVVNLRGRVIPVVDQHSRFGSEAGAGQGGGRGESECRGEGRRRAVVVTVDGRPVGFIVDAVSGIVSLRASQIEPTPALTAGAGELFTRVASLDGGARLILLIEPREMLDRVERDLLASLEALTVATET